ncbi:glycosyltransferase family 4 protein [Bacteriovorax sp. PP10]|uniref:Glycosyltransferase family 4 protein n=1 Tax=Bacteriovorax antarcticus TaxID=3088717 RepID=A0ABU5VVL3_9BACT|nr:glycosyltransferase family 4 protein [Bacteriovorax sp. PP10]MEA9356642.1 glycosyltransferase family 4 protein [Bacteriovorax sp. PP10]
MKILVVTQYFWPENFRINDLCDALIERGHEVTVYTGLPNYPEGTFFKGYSYFGPYKEYRGKIKVIRSPLIPRGKNKSLKLVFNYFSFFFLSSLLAPFLVRGKFDKIFVYEPSPITVAIPGIVLKYLKNAPMFFWVTDLWPESLEATGVVKNKKILNVVGSLVKVLYKHSDKILVTSKGFIPRVKALGGKDSQIVYFPQWAEELFSRTPDPHFHDSLIPQEGFKVMFAGNIGSSQDFETLVKAATILKDNKNIYFLILGDGLMKSWAEQEVAKQGIANNFIFLGRKPVDLMPEYYSKADAMLMSLTNTDLFSITVPSKLQSYLASKKPIIASMNGEGAQIVEDFKAGLTCPAGNPQLLAEKILKISTFSKTELDLMGENSLKCYQSEFEREKLITLLEEEFKKV